MSGEAPKSSSTADLLSTLIDEIRGLRADLTRNAALPDLKIRKAKMRDWKGPSYEGRVASECPSDFLLEYAGFLEWMAGAKAKDGDEGAARQAANHATLARRWATFNKHIRPPEKQGGWAAPKQDEAPPDTQDSRREGDTAAAPKAKWGGGWPKKANGQ